MLAEREQPCLSGAVVFRTVVFGDGGFSPLWPCTPAVRSGAGWKRLDLDWPWKERSRAIALNHLVERDGLVSLNSKPTPKIECQPLE